MFDLIIIGAGPGGYVAALEAGRLGLKTAVIEKDRIGGVCLNYGCIPTKSILHSSKLYRLSSTMKRFGISAGDISIDQKTIFRHKDQCVSRLVSGIRNLFDDRKIEYIEGKAEIKQPDEVFVEGRTLRTKNILIAAGSIPADIPPARFDSKYILSSKDALSLQEIPNSVLVVGGGVIGLEMATFWASFKVKVRLVEMLPELLPNLEDEMISNLITDVLKKMKIKITTGEKLRKTEVKNDKILCYLNTEEEIEVDKVLLATGRKPDKRSFENLEGIELDSRGYIKTDDHCMTSIEGIYACGDIIGEPYLAHKASYEGEIAVADIAGEVVKRDITTVPACIFTNPEIATVGLNPSQADKRGIKYIEGIFSFSSNGKAMTAGIREGFVRIVARDDNHRVIGGQIIGENANLLLGEITLAVKAGLKIETIAECIHIHPTLGEIVMEAARDALGKPLHQPLKR